jgi:hypothetical protein
MCRPGCHRWHTDAVSAESQQDAEVVAVPVRWNLESVPTLFANQFVATLGPPTAGGVPDGIYLVLGAVAPPIIIGDTPEARKAYVQAAMRDGLTVEVHGRYVLSRERLDEVITALETIRDKYDEAASAGTTAGQSSALMSRSAE